MKAILVLEMPSSCLDCPLGKNMSIPLETCIQCPLGKCAIDEETKTIPNWCPLKPMIEKKDRNKVVGDYLRGRCDGYNACIDEILGDKE